MKFIEYIFDELFDEEGNLLGIESISLVDRPAHRSEFLAFSDSEKVMFSAVDEDKRLLIGPVMIPGITPGTPLKGAKGKITKETITKLMNNYVKRGGGTTVHHTDKVEDCYFVRHWQVDRNNGVNAGYGFDSGEKKVEDGTWMGAMYVGNDDVWFKDVKSGEVSGFSIEGRLRPKELAMSDLDYHIKETEKLFKELFEETNK